MSVVERNVLPKIGPLFFSGDDGEPMFQYTSDASSVVGPRRATDRDKEAHAGAWAMFSETLPDAQPAPAEQRQPKPPAKPVAAQPAKPKPAARVVKRQPAKRKPGRPRKGA